MKRFQMFLPASLLSDARKHSNRTGIPVAEIIRRALEKFLKDQKP